MAGSPRYKDSKYYEDRDAMFEAQERRIRYQGQWCAKHPGCCPMCGRPESVHEELGGCPYFMEEEESC